MKRFHIINHLIDLYKYSDYLEIGVRRPADNFDRIKAKNKDGVDPRGGCKFKVTSDDFFKYNTKTYDIIFIDGLHEENQVMRDIDNSLRFLNENGTIVVHDCNPRRKIHQSEEYDHPGIWNGTVWRAFARMRSTRPDLYMKVVRTDYGIGIIRNGDQELFNLNKRKLTFKLLKKNRVELLNLISRDEFLDEFKK